MASWWSSYGGKLLNEQYARDSHNNDEVCNGTGLHRSRSTILEVKCSWVLSLATRGTKKTLSRRRQSSLIKYGIAWYHAGLILRQLFKSLKWTVEQLWITSWCSSKADILLISPVPKTDNGFGGSLPCWSVGRLLERPRWIEELNATWWTLRAFYERIS